jgi:hypothetical protein
MDRQIRLTNNAMHCLIKDSLTFSKTHGQKQNKSG